MYQTTIRKGRIGELLVIKDLLEKGFDVYTPIVDDNGVDLVVMEDNESRKVQVKSHDNPSKSLSTSVEVNTRLCRNVDVIAVPIKPINCICYIKAKEARRAFTIAYLPSLSGQKAGRNWYEDYLEFPWD